MGWVSLVWERLLGKGWGEECEQINCIRVGGLWTEYLVGKGCGQNAFDGGG